MIYILFNQSTYGNNNENDQVLDSFEVLYQIYIFLRGCQFCRKQLSDNLRRSFTSYLFIFELQSPDPNNSIMWTQL